jgi:hypothetical protein
MKTYKCHRFPPEIISNPWPITTVILAGLYGIPKNSSGRVYGELLLERGLYPGVDILDVPDEVDAVDAGGGGGG